MKYEQPPFYNTEEHTLRGALINSVDSNGKKDCCLKIVLDDLNKLGFHCVDKKELDEYTHLYDANMEKLGTHPYTSWYPVIYVEPDTIEDNIDFYKQCLIHYRHMEESMDFEYERYMEWEELKHIRKQLIKLLK